jgi:hypothetical protein
MPRSVGTCASAGHSTGSGYASRAPTLDNSPLSCSLLLEPAMVTVPPKGFACAVHGIATALDVRCRTVDHLKQLGPDSKESLIAARASQDYR